MAEPQPASGGLTDQAALGCCSDPDPSTKVGAEPISPESGPKDRADPRAQPGPARTGFEPHAAACATLSAWDGPKWAGERGLMVCNGGSVRESIS